jgi:4'-phosphopantetheinyl transferase EntD
MAVPTAGIAGAIDPALQRDIESLAVPGLLIGHRLISPGDEDALLDAEAASIASAVIEVRRASGAARIVARGLLAQLGCSGIAVPRGASGEPIWPAGMSGSLAHDERVAVAAVGKRSEIGTVGIDVEPAEVLPPEMLELIATPQELRKIAADPLRGRLLFAVKEAVYKAVFPRDREFLEFRDIEVDLAARKAVTRTGHALALRFCISSRVLAVALLAPGQA